MEWIYEKNEDNTARYVLGTIGAHPLACFGINPSTAEPNNLDPTVRRVQLVAKARAMTASSCSTYLTNVPQTRRTRHFCILEERGV